MAGRQVANTCAKARYASSATVCRPEDAQCLCVHRRQVNAWPSSIHGGTRVRGGRRCPVFARQVKVEYPAPVPESGTSPAFCIVRLQESAAFYRNGKICSGAVCLPEAPNANCAATLIPVLGAQRDPDATESGSPHRSGGAGEGSGMRHACSESGSGRAGRFSKTVNFNRGALAHKTTSVLSHVTPQRKMILTARRHAS